MEVELHLTSISRDCDIITCAKSGHVSCECRSWLYLLTLFGASSPADAVAENERRRWKKIADVTCAGHVCDTTTPRAPAFSRCPLNWLLSPLVPLFTLICGSSCGCATAGNRIYTAKTVTELKPFATFRKTTAAFRRQKYLHRTAAWTAISVKGVLATAVHHRHQGHHFSGISGSMEMSGNSAKVMEKLKVREKSEKVREFV